MCSDDNDKIYEETGFLFPFSVILFAVNLFAELCVSGFVTLAWQYRSTASAGFSGRRGAKWQGGFEIFKSRLLIRLNLKIY